MKARVTVYPRREILDPQGKAICSALSRIGIDGVEDVRAGKSFDIRLATDDPGEAERLLRTMCEKLLANPIVEEYAVELDGAAPMTAPAAGAPAAGGDNRP